jgi:hypothetical protein
MAGMGVLSFIASRVTLRFLYMIEEAMTECSGKKILHLHIAAPLACEAGSKC